MSNPFEGKHGPLLIAEIGGNHEGDFDYAKKLTNLAIDCDVDYVKFQMYTGDTLVSRVESPERNEHFEKFELEKSQYLELAEICEDGGAKFLASIWDPEMIDWVDEYHDIYKIGSGDLTAYPMLEEFAERGKPIILSTGLSSFNEVFDTINYLQSVNEIYQQPDQLAILQCTSMYPIPDDTAHLDVMNSFGDLTPFNVGYSDHTVGNKSVQTALTMGADVVEFHFTNTRENQSFRDHKVSLVPEEVEAVIDHISRIKRLKGNNVKRPLDVEGDHVRTFRRAVYPSRKIEAGETLTDHNLTVLRPNHGIDAREYDRVLGSEAARQLKAHQAIRWDDLK